MSTNKQMDQARRIVHNITVALSPLSVLDDLTDDLHKLLAETEKTLYRKPEGPIPVKTWEKLNDLAINLSILLKDINDGFFDDVESK